MTSRRKTLMKILVKVALFAAIFGVLYYVIFDALYEKDIGTATMLGGFFEQEEDTIDVVFLGSSTTYAYVNTPMAYHKNGFAAWDLCSGAQPFTATKSLIEEAEKKQNPDLYVVSIGGVYNKIDDPIYVRRVSSYMPRSLNRVNGIRDMLESMVKENTTTFWDYYFVYPYFHNKWTELKWTDFFQAKRAHEIGEAVGVYKGFSNGWYDAQDWQRALADDPAMYYAAPKQISKESESWLRELLEYCQTVDAEFLFMSSPTAMWEDHYAYLNYAFDVVESYGFDTFRGYEMMDEMGIDLYEDFYEGGHLNNYGATKFTNYLSAYLEEHYDLPDHRGDERYQSWEDEYQKERKACITGSKLLHHYIDTLAWNGYDGLLLWSDFDPMEKETEGLLELIPELDVDQWRGQELAIRFEDGAVVEYQSGDMVEIKANRIFGYAGATGCDAIVSGKEYICRKGGVLGVAYDAETGELIDEKAFYADWARDLFSSEAEGKIVIPNVQEELDAGWTDVSALQMLGKISDNLIYGYGFYPKETNIWTDCIMALEDTSCDGQTVYVEFEDSEGMYRAYKLGTVKREDFAQANEKYLMGGAGVYVDYSDIPIGTYKVRLFREENGEILYPRWIGEVILEEKPYIKGTGQ